jgi:hypothetical protein
MERYSCLNSLTTKSIPQSILVLNNLHRQRLSNSKQHKHSPLPAERVDDKREHKPVDQFAVGEEIEGSPIDN